MVVKRRKIGGATVTINTKTGRQTTSRRVGNITYSQSNQGHNRTTQTFNFGNGWFERKTTNWNKKKRVKKTDWSWLLGTTKQTKTTYKPVEVVEVKKEPFVGPPFPVFWKRKKLKQFTASEWFLWLLVSPFRITMFMVRWMIILAVIGTLIKCCTLMI